MSDAPPGTAGASVAVVGAGPAGLIAAETLAAAGMAVTVYERMPSAGRRLLMAGRGGLNLTHSEELTEFLERYSGGGAALHAAVEAFPPAALRDWAEKLGQETFVGSSGRVFPRAMKASPLLRAWLERLRELGVVLCLRHEWRGWDAGGRPVFAGPDGQEKAVHCGALLLALGGASWPRLGARGDWCQRLQDRGVALRPLRPANCGFTLEWSGAFRTRFSGQPLKTIAFSFEERWVRGEAVVSAYGLEGGAVYALSAPLREAIQQCGRATLHVDLRPDLSEAALASRLNRVGGAASLANLLRKGAGLSPLKANLLREAVRLPPRDPRALARLIKALPLVLTGTQPLERAISSAGGLAWSELDKRFMLRSLPGVFAAGEMLDWEAPTGGYLLQACFATGVAAAKGVLDWLSTEPAQMNGALNADT